MTVTWLVSVCFVVCGGALHCGMSPVPQKEDCPIELSVSEVRIDEDANQYCIRCRLKNETNKRMFVLDGPYDYAVAIPAGYWKPVLESYNGDRYVFLDRKNTGRNESPVDILVPKKELDSLLEGIAGATEMELLLELVVCSASEGEIVKDNYDVTIPIKKAKFEKATKGIKK